MSLESGSESERELEGKRKDGGMSGFYSPRESGVLGTSHKHKYVIKDISVGHDDVFEKIG